MPSITLDVYGLLPKSLREEATPKIDELRIPVDFFQLHQEMVDR
jgi:hypothetical protein